MAVVYDPPPGVLSQYPRLRVIFALSAGVDRLMDDPTLPAVPLVRLVHEDIVAAMREYVLYHVLKSHRDFGQYEELQRRSAWSWPAPSRRAQDYRVSVLGIGRLGLPCVIALKDLGFDVVSWRRRDGKLAPVPCHTGLDGLERVLARSDLLVCLLPLTEDTHGLLDARAFALMPKGAHLLNVGRAGCLVEADLLAAVESGQIEHATLDVFYSEPLPHSHPFWRHPRITVTPHAAANAGPAACAAALAETLDCLREGRPLQNVVDRTTGY